VLTYQPMALLENLMEPMVLLEKLRRPMVEEEQEYKQLNQKR